MARGSECRCTVPLAEYGFTWSNNVDREAWVKLNGVTIVDDYLGRPAVSLDDAYKLRARQIEAEKEAERQYQVRLATVAANKERQEIFNEAMRAETKGRGMPPEGAVARCLKVVAAHERTLPREVRVGLDALSVSMMEMTF